MKFFPRNLNVSESLEFMGQASAAALPQSFNLLVWNIYKARRALWREDFLRLLPGQHLILLQESVLNSRHDDIFQNCQDLAWVMAKSFVRQGIMTGTKTGAIAKAQFSRALHSPHSEPVWRTRKTLLVTRYKIENYAQELLVLNMHAINFVGLEKFRRHLAQLRDAMAEHAGPVILGGDFNTWSRARFDYFSMLMAENGLYETPLERQAQWRHFNRHLDHVFFRGLTLAKAEVLTDIASSDHYPIQASFTVKI